MCWVFAYNRSWALIFDLMRHVGLPGMRHGMTLSCDVMKLIIQHILIRSPSLDMETFRRADNKR